MGLPKAAAVAKFMSIGESSVRATWTIHLPSKVKAGAEMRMSGWALVNVSMGAEGQA